MPRRVEDILPNEHRSIREIPVRGGEIRIKKVAHVSTPKPIILENKFKVRRVTHRNRFKISQKTIIIIGGIVSLVVIGYFASSYFSRAVFTITPKTVSININSSYVATSVPKEGLLTYKIMKSERYSSTTVPAIDGPSTSAKATGLLNIFNAYSSTARKLIAGTRFSSPSGRIYKLSSSIMIPGYKTSGTGDIIPGSIKSLVVADQVGTEYNVENTGSPKIFKIVAYNGGDKYDKLYGELANNIKGGASGNKKIVNPTILASTIAALKTKLTDELEAMIKRDVPSEYYMFDKSFLSFESEISDSSANQATVTVHGMIYCISIKKSELVTKLAGQPIIDSFGGLKFDPVGLDELTFTLSNQKDFSPEKSSTAVMQLKGVLTLTGKIPVDELKRKFAGVSLSDTAQILRAYSSIIDLTRSSGQVVPPWSKIPINMNKISIIVQ